MAAAAALTLGVVLIGGSAAASGRPDPGSSILLRSTLSGSLPSGPEVAGEEPAHQPWKLKGGSAVLLTNGTIVVHLDKLTTARSGKAEGINHVVASLACAGRRKVVARTKAATLATDGTTTIKGTFELPAICAAPAVLVNPNESHHRYIAVSGHKSAAVTTTTTAPPPTTRPTARPSTVAMRKTVLGTVLVDKSGYTLFLFLKDEPHSGTSACTGACPRLWPPLITTGHPTAGAGVNSALLGTITRKNGSKQVTYNGWPLYTSHRDRNPGQVAGEALHQFGARWYAVSPAGRPVTERPGPASGSYGNGGS